MDFQSIQTTRFTNNDKRGTRLPLVCEIIGCREKARWRVDGVCACLKHGAKLKYDGLSRKPDRDTSDYPICSVEGCERKTRRKKAKLCEMHYGYWYRRGTFEPAVRGGIRKETNGYRATTGKGHPCSTKHGHVSVHRRILYDEIGPGIHQCHWCQQEIEWGVVGKRKLVVDHLNGKKSDNNLKNLVPSCHRCNSMRGQAMRWFDEHPYDPQTEKFTR